MDIVNAAPTTQVATTSASATTEAPVVSEPDTSTTEPEPPVTEPDTSTTEPEPPVTEPEPPVTEPEPPTTEPEPPVTEPEPPTVTPPLVDGAALFAMECTVCHSEGRSGADLQWSSLEEEEIVAVTADGRDGTFMRPWKDRLTAEEIKAVAAYVKSLQPG